ncbi:SIMPL domain-containing protein [Nocardioides sp. URHA0020]|uniref:SIMPL domain-containing protein n=1 Tax=Nocardioides sp. URHA0020 TaxID=1380392 RepID=UPI00048D5E78|nr:SIMPL domain-containing protein [Nocardioides sp. URHA0020]
MPQTVITVQGTYDAFHPAERATVTVTVGFEGPERTAVVTRTTQGTAALVAGIRAKHDPAHGPVTWHATDRIQVWSSRPFNNKGEQLPLVHHAQTTTRAKFRDFDDLAQWVERAAVHPGVRIDGVEWALTAQTQQGATTTARTRAVEEARAKAHTYAEALGLGDLRCLAIADPGMLGDNTSSTSGGGQATYSRAAKAESGGGGLAFTPEDIAVSATVDARFEAS